MYFPVALFVEDGAAYGASVPDIPGCNTAGDSLEEALANIQDAVELALEGQGKRPTPSSIEMYWKQPEYQGAMWALVNIDLGFMDERTVRVNVTFPAGTLEEIDKAAKGRGLTRSAFLARAARQAMAQRV